MTSATGIAAAVQGGQDARVAVQEALSRAQADRNNSLVRIHAQAALELAQQVNQRVAYGETLPLAGVPMVLKDNLCWKGFETTCCSKMLQGWKAPYSATAVEKLLAAGAIPIAQANMDEFAMGSSNETSIYGPVRHPKDPTRIPGGSSGGCAAAVAAGIVPVAIGSDTGGSIRQPAALCGTWGLKPTYGRVSRYGLIAYGSSLDQIGPLAANAGDTLLTTQVLSGFDHKDSTSVPSQADAPIIPKTGLKGLRLGYIPAHQQLLDPAMAAHVHSALEAARAAGASIVEVDLPHEQYATAMYYIIATGEASSNLSRYDGIHYGYRSSKATDLQGLYGASRAEGFGTEVKRRILLGTYVLSAGYYDAYYVKAMQVRRLLCQDYAQCFTRCDVLLGLASPTTAFRLGEKTSDPIQMYLADVFTISANLAGIPALALPWATHQDGLPVGLHLQGPQWSEARLFQVAQALQH